MGLPQNILVLLIECYLQSNIMNDLPFSYHFIVQRDPYLSHFMLTEEKDIPSCSLLFARNFLSLMFRRNVGWQEKRVGEKRKEGRERQIQPCTGCCIKQPSLASIRTLTKWGSVLSGVGSAPIHLIVWPWLRWNLFLKEMGKLEPWCFSNKVTSEVINDPEVGFGSRGGYFLGSPQRCHKQRRSLEREKGVWEEDDMSRKHRKESVRWCHGRKKKSHWILCL